MALKFWMARAIAGLSCSIAVTSVIANPVAPVPVNGQATFNAGGNKLTITNTPGAVINWQSFSIGTSELTRFVQQSASSAVLNRSVDAGLSSILGQLQSTGKPFLINPNGIAPAGVPTQPNMAKFPQQHPSLKVGAYQKITSDGAHSFRVLPPPPGAASRAVLGTDGIVRLTGTP